MSNAITADGFFAANAVDTSVNGEKLLIKWVAAVLRTSRHADTPLVETPHTRRMVTMSM